jgi:acyl dehydratase
MSALSLADNMSRYRKSGSALGAARRPAKTYVSAAFLSASPWGPCHAWRMPEPADMYYEDLALGRVYRTAAVDVTAEEIRTFAARYDPQPFHLDAAAAQESVFGGLVASGWLTAALTMRLMVQSEFRFGSGVVGLGVDTLKWPRPVRPGDRLTATIEITAMRVSASKPGFGVMKIKTTTANQREETVQVMVSNVLVRRKGTSL